MFSVSGFEILFDRTENDIASKLYAPKATFLNAFCYLFAQTDDLVLSQVLSKLN